MNEAERNYQLLQEIERNRLFLLQMYAQNPSLLKTVEPHIRDLLKPLGEPEANAAIYHQRGVSLIELIMFIVIVSVALTGLLLVMNVTTKSSADPLIHKQALAIAESLLEEVELMPFTFCDPDDTNAASAVAASGSCAVASNEESATIGPEAGETRYSATTPFDNVSDYHGFSMSGAGGIRDITNTAISSSLDGYSASVSVSAGTLPSVTAGDALLIAVTVTGPGGKSVTVEGMRTRYAPRTIP